MKPIVVLGSLNADLVSRSARLPATGETVTGSGFATYPGGKGANQAVAAGKLGGEVWMLGAVGDDAFGTMLIESLRGAGVHTELVEHCTGTSGVALINTDDAGDNRIVVVPGANAEVSIDYVLRHRRTIEEASVLLLQLEVPLESVTMAASLAKQAGVPVILDPAPARPLPKDLLQSVTWLTPNDSEADVLLAAHGPQRGALDTGHRAQALLALGATNVLLKRGELGAVVATSDGNTRSVDAFSVAAVDTTAAGDAFNAGFAVALTRGKTPDEAVRFASAVAAISVTRAGAQPSMPAGAEVDEFLSSR
jgi:ribokinase